LFSKTNIHFKNVEKNLFDFWIVQEGNSAFRNDQNRNLNKNNNKNNDSDEKGNLYSKATMTIQLV
jgi:hypothetical protein